MVGSICKPKSSIVILPQLEKKTLLTKKKGQRSSPPTGLKIRPTTSNIMEKDHFLFQSYDNVIFNKPMIINHSRKDEDLQNSRKALVFKFKEL